MSGLYDTGARPSIDKEQMYPGLVQGITPLQERESGSEALQSGNKPALVIAGLILALVVVRFLWEAAK